MDIQAQKETAKSQRLFAAKRMIDYAGRCLTDGGSHLWVNVAVWPWRDKAWGSGNQGEIGGSGRMMAKEKDENGSTAANRRIAGRLSGMGGVDVAVQRAI